MRSPLAITSSGRDSSTSRPSASIDSGLSLRPKWRSETCRTRVGTDCVLSASGLSQRLSENANMDSRNRITIGQTIGNVVFWLVFLLFLPAILDTLQLQGILAPVQGMVDSILGALPNILGAVVVLGVGWLVARVVRPIVLNLLVGWALTG